jgi:hypothetical protein
MYTHNEEQLEFEDFHLPFDGRLRSDNRWVRLAKLIPWKQVEKVYVSSLSGTGQGTPAKSVRVALGALIIKERLSTSDEETVEQIRENPYLQYFLGRKRYKDEQLFHPTMFVHFRKRFPSDTLNGSRQQYKTLLVISEVYRQQKWMYDHRSLRIDDRIVSINKPHVRPIKRGKAGASTEFGAKISASVVEGFVFADRISWNNFNESTDLINQIKAYRARHGFYPESVHADKIYRTQGNRKFCKKHGIRMSGPKLGRPPKPTEENKVRLQEARQQAHQDELDRIPIEGKFGLGKRRYGLNRIMTKLSFTSKTSIAITFLVMNLEKWLKAILLSLIQWQSFHFMVNKTSTDTKLAFFTLDFDLV